MIKLDRFSFSCAFFCLFTFLAGVAQAATFTVDRSDDSAAAGAQTCSDAAASDCSLRGAIIKANDNNNQATVVDVIMVPAGTYNITIANGAEGFGNAASDDDVGDIDITEPVTITGAGASTTTVQVTGTGDDRIFHLPSSIGGLVTIQGLTLTGGNPAGRGGAIQVFSDNDITVTACHITGNSSTSEGGGMAFESTGTMTLNRVTVSDNEAAGRGGGLFFETGDGTITNSTFAGNSNTGDGTNNTGGAGIDVSTSAADEVFIFNSTIVNNTEATAGSVGGGLRRNDNVRIRNSILAGNTVNGTVQNCGSGGNGTLTSGGYNISTDASCGLAGTGDQQSVTGTILADTLDENGGETPNYLPVTGSPAIDAVPVAACLDASNAALTEDQRGLARPLEADGGTTACDAGAVETGCGNGVVEADEDCDDGNNTAGDGCSASCANEGSSDCGDGVLQQGEDCDDDNTVDGDGCSSTCEDESDDLEAENPSVDFFNLSVGDVVSLVAPSPAGGAADEDACTCAWSVGSNIGSFSSASTCATDFTVEDEGNSTLTVAVDCGADGAETFTQSLAAAVAGGSGSGGCRLSPSGEGASSGLLLFMGSIVALVFVRVKAKSGSGIL